MNAVSESVTARSAARPAATSGVPVRGRGRDLGRGRRVALLDRSWLGSWSTLFASPLSPSPIEEIRAALAAVLSRHPEHAVVSRLDVAAGRWRPVPAEDVTAYCEQVVTAVPDPGPEETDAFVDAHVLTDSWPAAFRLLVGPQTATLYMSHALGDARTLSRLLHALVTADADALIALEPRAQWGTVAAGLAADVRKRRTRYRRPDGPPAHTGAAITAPPGPDEARLVTRMVDNAAVRELMRWRKQNAAGVALSSLLTSAVCLALVDQGVPIDRSGYYGLVDVRRYLRPSDQDRSGNLAKSLYLATDPADPRAVEAALSAALDSGWALPSTLYGSLVTALRPAHEAAPADASGRVVVSPVALSVSVMPSLPGIDSFPWSGSGQRRFIGVGSPNAGPSVNVFAFRMRSHLELAATFRSAAVPADKVQLALDALTDPAAVLDAHAVTSAGEPAEPDASAHGR